MFVSESGATFTIIAFIVSILIIVGGCLFSKFSKSNEKLKRGISFGMCIWGGLTTILNAPAVWRIINGTFVEPENNAFSRLYEIFGDRQDVTTDVSYYASPTTVEIFDMVISLSTLGSVISIGLGLLMVISGLVYKKNNWAKVTILAGVVTIITGIMLLISFAV